MDRLEVISSSEMKRVEGVAIKKGFSEKKFMEEAGKNIAKEIEKLKISKSIFLLLGKGNNAQDGLLAARFLLKKGFKASAFFIFEKKFNSSFLENLKKFKKEGGVVLDRLDIKKEDVIIDAIVGTGFKGSIDKKVLKILEKINDLSNKKVSIDIPSFVDGDTGEVKKIAFKADYTIFLQLPKKGFFLNEARQFIGKLKCANFGLKKEFIEKSKIDFYFLKEKKLKRFLPKIKRDRNKYEAGSILAIAGKEGMEGAAYLSSYAAMRAGAGIVNLYSTSHLKAKEEVITKKIDFENVEEIVEKINRSDCVFIGPGVGRDKKFEKFFLKILPKIKTTTVLDADALFLLSKNLKVSLPKKTILTPHRKEMKRLLNKKNVLDEKLLKETQKFAIEKDVLIILKGFPTFIISNKNSSLKGHLTKKTSSKYPLIIDRGTAGMATAGMGDVLTGILASFISQKLDMYTAAELAVFILGYAAEIVDKEKTVYSTIASDVIEYLPRAFLNILKGKVD